MGTITNARARAIAADWHGGQRSALLSLATTGRLTDNDLPRALDEVEAELDSDNLSAHNEVELCKLRRYLRAEGRTRGLLED